MLPDAGGGADCGGGANVGTVADPRRIVILSQVAWDDVWQRPQEQALRLAGHAPVVYSSPVQVHQWLFTLGRRWRPVRLAAPGVVVLSPLVFSGSFRSRGAFIANSVLEAMQVGAFLPAGARVHLLANTPFAAEVLRRLFWPSVRRSPRLARFVYDLIDDFTAFDWAPAWSRDLDGWMMAHADAVVTGTERLCEERMPVRPDTEFIACGVDFGLFSRPAPEPPELAGMRRPIIGYIGSITDRLNLELVRRVAEAHPAGDVVLIGPVHPSAGELPRLPNIHYLGLRPHDALPGFVQRFAVGLIPFRTGEAALKLNPVKTLEYLAAGIPVVSVALPDVVRFFAPAVRVARDADDFVAAVVGALARPDPARREAGLAMARAASWDEMAVRFGRKLFVTPTEDR